MSGFAAFGCNPEHHWTVDLTNPAQPKIAGDNPTSAAPPGTLAYSPAGGLYVCFQANGAIASAGACVQLGGNWQGSPVTTNSATRSRSLCFAQAAFADDEYGWGLVFGQGLVLVNAQAAAGAQLYTTGSDGRLDDAATAIHIGGVELTAARGGGVGTAMGMVTWPRVDLIA